MNWKCLLGCDWVYSDWREVYRLSGKELVGHVYDKRVCHKCGKIQNNNVVIAKRWDYMTYTTYWGVSKQKWTTIGYKE